MYKIITIDLDGTLLNSRGEISSENRNAIKMAKEQGIEVVLASGRVSDSVLNIAKDIGADKYFICGNGSMIYDMQKDKVIYENFINKSKMLKLVKMCDENSIYYNIYSQESVITKSINYNVAVYNYENTKKPNDKKTRINIVEDVYKYVEESDNNKYLKMTICDNNKIIFSSILRKLKNIPNIDILDVSHIGIKEKEIATIGDNMNDLMMIKNSGMGVAMGNSSPIIKDNANFITKGNDENGVAIALKNIIE